MTYTRSVSDVMLREREIQHVTAVLLDAVRISTEAWKTTSD